MNERNAGGLKVWTPLLFSLVMILGMVLGFNLRDSLRNKRNIVTVLERNDRLEQIIDLINEKYVDTVNVNALYDDAVNGILSHLDPHTIYITKDNLQSVNEDMEGSFFGIGVEFSIVKDTIQITSVVDNGPAAKVNMEVGDRIIKVGDSTVAGTNITSDRIIKMLRGKENSKVPLLIHSPLSNRTRSVTLQRGSIPLYSLDAAFMLDKQTGYMRINRFSATTYNEFTKALKELVGKGMTNLILDLRQNPGGYLDAATSIADDFLSGDKLIVYTEGRKSMRIEYGAGVTDLFEKGKLAVLVDESSASASEIVAGAIQDHDRGIIIGRRTFGKGLVQEQYNLEDGSALRLTIAKYYTPSGRSIQRTYAKGKQAYAEAYAKRYETGELTGGDTVNIGDTTKYYTDHKRVVYGGGGIDPDIYIPYDTLKYNTTLLNLIYSESFRNAVLNYYIKNQTELKKIADVDEYIKMYSVEDMRVMILTALPKDMQAGMNKLIQKPAMSGFIDLQMKAQLAKILFKNTGYYAVLATQDHMIKKAAQTIESDEYSKVIGR